MKIVTSKRAFPVISIFTGILFLQILLSPLFSFGQHYVINRGSVNNAFSSLCVIDKNEYYTSFYASATQKATVSHYKNGIITSLGSVTDLPLSGNATGMARDSVNDIFYLAFENATADTIYTYKKAAADANWVYVAKLPRPNVSNTIISLYLQFNVKTSKLYIAFDENTVTPQIYLFRLDAGAWTNLTGGTTMYAQNSRYKLASNDNKVFITTSYNNKVYLHIYDVDLSSLSSVNYTTNNSYSFSSSAYNPVTGEYAVLYTASGTLYPDVVKYNGTTWSDMSTGIPADAVANGSFGCYIGFNNRTGNFSLFYAGYSVAWYIVKGYYWNGSTWVILTVPWSQSTNIFAAVENYKDMYFVSQNWPNNNIVIHSQNEVPFRNTQNITTASGSTNCVLNFSQRGVGNKVAIFIKAAASYDAPVPVNNTTYTANTAMGSGTQISASGWYCVYNGVGESFTVTGLANNTTYQVHAFEYNGDAAAEIYWNGGSVTGNPTSFTTSCINPTSAGSISTSQSGNSPFDPAAFTSVAAATGYSGGALEYKWQKSTTSNVAGFTDIAASNSATYDAAAITTTTWYKRIARTNCKVDWTGALESNVIEVTVTPTWLGTVSADWNTLGNWSAAAVPSSGNIYVSPSAVNPLVMGTDYFMGVINFDAGSPKLQVGNYTLTATSVTGYNSTSYIQTNGTGAFKMNVAQNATVLFPVGNSAYNPVSITNNSGSADDFSVKVLNEVYANGTGGAVISYARVMRTWDISKNNVNGGSGVDFVFNWNGGEENGTMVSPVLYHNGGSWGKPASGSGNYVAASTQLSYTGYTGTFSPFAVVDGTSPLMVSGFNLHAEKIAAGVLLYWSTGTEQNSKEFIIEYSRDGIHFLPIGKIAAAGISITQQKYSFIHYAPEKGNNYYRIAENDNNGSQTYSATVNVPLSSGSYTIQLLNNPVANGQLSIKVPKATLVTVINSSAQVVVKATVTEGLQHIDISTLARGLYIVQSEGTSIMFIKE